MTNARVIVVEQSEKFATAHFCVFCDTFGQLYEEDCLNKLCDEVTWVLLKYRIYCASVPSLRGVFRLSDNSAH